jgi:hypothetical protein
MLYPAKKAAFRLYHAEQRRLYRELRGRILASAVKAWPGTRSALKRLIGRLLRPHRRCSAFLRRALQKPAMIAFFTAAALAGSLSAPASAIELSDVAAGTGGFIINGIDAYDNSGFSVSGAGDVNGDGLADLIVGAYRAAPAGTSNAGESYVVFGKNTGSVVNLSDVASGTGGFIINGIDANDISGNSVSGAGDVNGDGLADLIVGAKYADPAGNSNAGESYVVFSPETPAVTATYQISSMIGDASRRAVGESGDGSDSSTPASRCWLDFDAGDNGSGEPSQETATLTRNNLGISNLAPPGFESDVADVVWEINTDRVNWTSAAVTLKYLDSEIAGISGVEADLGIFTAPALSGPWTFQPTTKDAARNELRATVSGFAFFAIGNDNTIPVEVSGYELD